MKPSMKKKMTVILSAVLVLAIAAGASLAYLATLTEQKENAFTFAENIKARLEEPNWKPEDGQNLIPGALVRKDPIVTNVSNNDVDEFVAVRVTFTDCSGAVLSDDADAGYAAYVGRLLRILDITWDLTNWELADSEYEGKAEQVWVYTGILVPGETTPPLFSSVTIKSSWYGPETALGDEDALPDWDTEFAWLASVVMNHTDDCYAYGVHNTEVVPCTITYRHHANCALFDGTNAKTAIEAAAKGVTVGSKTCDCKPVEVHEAECKYNIGTIECDDPTHTGDGIDGFQIILRAAAVQAGVDGMDAYDDASTIAALLALFTANPYIP